MTNGGHPTTKSPKSTQKPTTDEAKNAKVDVKQEPSKK